jgi:hypothetical protein
MPGPLPRPDQPTAHFGALLHAVRMFAPPRLRAGRARVAARLAAGLLAGAMLAPGPAAAQGSSHHCASISSTDQRALCRAVAEKKSHHCATITGSDQRAMCRAQAEGKPHHCATISSSDARAYCRAVTGG